MQLDIGPDDAVPVSDPSVLEAIITAIITHECGINPYSDVLIRRGVALSLEG